MIWPLGHCNNVTQELLSCRLCISDDATPWPSVSYNSKSTLKHMVIGSPSFPLLQRCWWGIPNDCQHWKCWWQSNDREAIRPDCCLDNRPARNREYNKLLMRKRHFYVDQAFICVQSTVNSQQHNSICEQIIYRINETSQYCKGITSSVT